MMTMTMCGSAPVSPPPASGRVIRLPPSGGKAKGRNTNYHDDPQDDHHHHEEEDDVDEDDVDHRHPDHDDADYCHQGNKHKVELQIIMMIIKKAMMMISTIEGKCELSRQKLC